MAKANPTLRPLDADEQRLARMLKALGNPVRFHIVQVLAERKMCITGELVEFTTLAQSTVSQHLKVLREAGLVTVEVRGQQRIYRLDPAGLDAFDAWLRRVRRFWSGHLDLLEQELAKPDPGEGDTR